MVSHDWKAETVVEYCVVFDGMKEIPPMKRWARFRLYATAT